MKRNTSITERLVLYYVVLSISAIATVGAIFYYLAKDALTDRTFNQLTSVRVVKAKQLERFFADRENDLRKIAELKESKFIASSLSYNYTNNILQNINTESLFNLLNTNVYIEEIIISDVGFNNTLILKKQNNLSFEKNYLGILKSKLKQISEKEISFIDTVDKSGENVIYLIAQIFSSKLSAGYCVLVMDYSEINKIMLENNPSGGLGNSGESYLVGFDLMMRSQSRFIPNSINKIKVATTATSSAENLINGTGIFKDYRSIEVLSSFSKLRIKNLEWIILAEIDLIEAEEPIIYLRNILMIVIAITSAITFGITFFLSKRISNPLIKLTNAVSSFSKGDFNKLKIPTHDEIEILADTFNEMAENLQQKEIELAEEKSLRLKEVIDKLDSERERLSRELHDGIGQSFIAMKLKMENCEFDSIENSKELIEDVKDNLNSIIDEIRRISNDLMPAVLYEFGLDTAVRNLCNSFREFTDFNINVNIHLSSLELEKAVKVYIFRIIQEALNNAVKHSHAENISVNLNYDKNRLIIEIIDDGIGFDMSGYEKGLGNGLHNMKERVNLLSGDFAIESKVNEGTTVRAVFDLNDGKN